MKIKVSKVFAKFVNETAKMSGKDFHANVVALSTSAAGWHGLDPYDEIDYNYETGKIMALCITYPADYYACPVYMSTRRLCAEFRRRGIKTVEQLRAMIVDMFEI